MIRTIRVDVAFEQYIGQGVMTVGAKSFGAANITVSTKHAFSSTPQPPAMKTAKHVEMPVTIRDLLNRFGGTPADFTLPLQLQRLGWITPSMLRVFCRVAERYSSAKVEQRNVVRALCNQHLVGLQNACRAQAARRIQPSTN